jgi:hypothetical protein
LNANVNTKVVSSFTNAMTVRVAADTGSLINGACYGIDYSMSIDIALENPLPGWQSGPQMISVYGREYGDRADAMLPMADVQQTGFNIGL